MTFMQVIEYRTTREKELESLFAEWLSATSGKRTTMTETHAKDRDDPRHYVDIVEFPSYERAMVNNDLPETNRYAERMRALCDGEPRFINLDVIRTERE
jgi:hypothetical protein